MQSQHEQFINGLNFTKGGSGSTPNTCYMLHIDEWKTNDRTQLRIDQPTYYLPEINKKICYEVLFFYEKTHLCSHVSCQNQPILK